MNALTSILALSVMVALCPLAQGGDEKNTRRTVAAQQSHRHYDQRGHRYHRSYNSYGRHFRHYSLGNQFVVGLGSGVPYYYKRYYGDYDYPGVYYDDYEVVRASPPTSYTTAAIGGSTAVAQVQTALAQQGYSSGRIDGQFGSGTRSAILRYQRDNGLVVTGNIDNTLLLSLGLRTQW